MRRAEMWGEGRQKEKTVVYGETASDALLFSSKWFS